MCPAGPQPNYSSKRTPLAPLNSGVRHMKRILPALMVINIAACSSGQFHNAPTSTHLSASLLLELPNQSLAPNRLGGIFAIDGQAVASESRNQVYLSPGTHKISYLCPGWMYVDGFPTIKRNFIVGKQYKLSCTTGSVTIDSVGA